MLEGEILYRAAEHEMASEALREAEPYRQRLALAHTDVPVQSSCFCRLEAHGAHKGLHEHERHGHGHQGHDHIAGAGEDHSCH